MIISFGDNETEKIWNQVVSRVLPGNLQQIMLRKLMMLNRSQNLNDLRVPPGNQLEKLKGKLSEKYSIRMNDQWRIIFAWHDNNAYEVRIVDYH